MGGPTGVIRGVHGVRRVLREEIEIVFIIVAIIVGFRVCLGLDPIRSRVGAAAHRRVLGDHRAQRGFVGNRRSTVIAFAVFFRQPRIQVRAYVPPRPDLVLGARRGAERRRWVEGHDLDQVARKVERRARLFR